MSQQSSHAIVIGGSMAGLVTARVLTNHFDRVTVIDRDHFPTEAQHRKGVPQDRHVHLLLVRGDRILEGLFPGLRAQLSAKGAPRLDLNAEAEWRNAAGWGARFKSDIVTSTCSRVLLEWCVRSQLAQDSRVNFIEGRAVAGLIAGDDKSRVTGVRTMSRDSTEPNSDEESHSADFVVDASGRESHAPEWLQELGYDKPQETVINSFVRYATRHYRKPAQIDGTWSSMLVSNCAPYLPRMGVIYPIENGEWLVLLAGIAKEYPPADDEGFLEYSRGLATGRLYEAIKDAEPLSPIYSYARTENRLRHYERMSRWPEHFVLLGDAVCAFNPIYGQGMTVAAMGAQALDKSLRRQRNKSGRDLMGLAARFQKGIARLNATPWLMATGEDFRWPTTEGGTPPLASRLTQKYVDRVQLVATQDILTKKTFVEVAHMLKPPTALFHPRVFLRVMKGVSRRSQAQPAKENVARG